MWRGAASAASRAQHRERSTETCSTETCSTETCSTERTPVKPAPFTYHRTRDVAETVALLAELGDEAKILAGGQSLVPMMNFRLARPSALVDVTRIPGLDYLRAGDDGLHVGALTRHRSVEITRDPTVLSGFAVLPRSARWIA